MNKTTLPISDTYDRLASLTTTRILAAWIKRDVKAKLNYRKNGCK